MTISYFCPRWGSADIPWDEFCGRVADAGYDGVETHLPQDEKGRDEVRQALDKHGLLLIGQYYQSFEKDFEAHKAAFRMHLDNLAQLDCVLIDSQTGKDYYPPAQNVELFGIAQEFTLTTGIKVAHETHRNKALYAAHRFKELVEYYPELEITADFSHWCCVSESLLEQQAETMELAVSKAVHIHARVGYQQGPQVVDPRAPEYKEAFEAHLSWWDAIISYRKSLGQQRFTITTEFGPVPYMPAHPYTKAPLASQWDINVFMMRFLRERYAGK